MVIVKARPVVTKRVGHGQPGMHRGGEICRFLAALTGAVLGRALGRALIPRPRNRYTIYEEICHELKAHKVRGLSDVVQVRLYRRWKDLALNLSSPFRDEDMANIAQAFISGSFAVLEEDMKPGVMNLLDDFAKSASEVSAYRARWRRIGYSQGHAQVPCADAAWYRERWWPSDDPDRLVANFAEEFVQCTLAEMVVSCWRSLANVALAMDEVSWPPASVADAATCFWAQLRCSPRAVTVPQVGRGWPAVPDDSSMCGWMQQLALRLCDNSQLRMTWEGWCGMNLRNGCRHYPDHWCLSGGGAAAPRVPLPTRPRSEWQIIWAEFSATAFALCHDIRHEMAKLTASAEIHELSGVAQDRLSRRYWDLVAVAGRWCATGACRSEEDMLQYMAFTFRCGSFAVHTETMKPGAMRLLDCFLQTASEVPAYSERWWRIGYGNQRNIRRACGEATWYRERWWLNDDPTRVVANFAEDFAQCILAEMAVDYWRGWAELSESRIALRRKIFLVSFSSHYKAFEEWLQQTPLWQYAASHGVDVKPLWAGGAKVFAAGLRGDGIDQQWIEHYVGRGLGPQHVVLTSEQWFFLEKLLRKAHVPKKPYPMWVLLIPTPAAEDQVNSGQPTTNDQEDHEGARDPELVTFNEADGFMDWMYEGSSTTSGSSTPSIACSLRTASPWPEPVDAGEVPPAIQDLGHRLNALAGHILSEQAGVALRDECSPAVGECTPILWWQPAYLRADCWLVAPWGAQMPCNPHFSAGGHFSATPGPRSFLGENVQPPAL